MNGSIEEKLEAFFSSYSGFDGGNPKGLWICGIEHGGGFHDLRDIDPILEHGSWDEQYKNKNPEFTTWKYHQKSAKLLLALNAIRNDIDPIIAMAEFHEYMKKSLYAENGESFKLNLFPLAATSVDSEEWGKRYADVPTLKAKQSYYEWCRSGGRFKFLRSQRKKFSPPVILGTGITFEPCFVSAFGFEGVQRETYFPENTNRKMEWGIYRGEGSTLIVTHFFGGRYGINSNRLLVEVARKIAEFDR